MLKRTQIKKNFYKIRFYTREKPDEKWTSVDVIQCLKRT